MKQYQAKNGNTQWKPSLSEALAASENSGGFCLACGEENSGVEPDARKYSCECCGAPKVYGAEELILMNLVH